MRIKYGISPIAVIFLGTAIFIAGVLTYDVEQRDSVSIPLKAGSTAKRNFTTHISSFEAEISWLPQTPKSYDRKHLETMAANIRAHLILLDAGGKEIQRQQISSPQVTDSLDNPKLAGTNVELHTEAYQKYTVILTIDSVGVPEPELKADLAVRLTPNASEGNEIWYWLITAWGV